MPWCQIGTPRVGAMSWGARVDRPEAVAGLRRHLPVALSLGGAAALLLHWPIVWVICTVLALAVALADQDANALALVPLAFVVVLAVVAGTLLVAGSLDVALLHSPAATTGLLLVMNAIIVLLAARGPDRPRVAARARWAWLAYVPAAVLALIALVGRFDRWNSLGWFLAGDNLRHLALAVRLEDSGALEYDTQTYPRAWHGLVAALWASGGPERDQAGLEALVATHSSIWWLGLVCVALALSTCARWAHRRIGAPTRLEPMSGFLAGAAFLGPQFMGASVPRGFQTSVLAVLVLLVALHQLLVAAESWRALMVAGLAVALMAHLWQILLPTAAVVLGVALVARGRARSGDHPRVLAVLVLTVVAAAPGVAGAVRGYGLSATSEAGDVPPPLLVWSVVALLACAWSVRRGEPAPAVPALAALATSFAMVMLLDLELADYYPNKTLWVGVVLAFPLMAACASLVVGRLDGGSLAARVGFVVAGAVLGLAAVTSVTATVIGAGGSWSSVDGGAVMSAVTSPRAHEAAVVWSAVGEREDAASQLLLDFYSATASTPPLGLAATAVEDQCALLVATPDPVAMSAADPATVRARFACVPALEVVPVTVP
jgi:hypothetical protein